MIKQTAVLIVGGSLNGLTAALCLARKGVKSIVIERHTSTSFQYKFRGISPRSMEIYRSLGIEAQIRACDTVSKAAAIARMKTVADPAVSWQEVPWPDAGRLSPVGPAVCDQDQLEPILKAHAEAQGAEVRFGTELIDFSQDGGGITARIRGADGTEIDTVGAEFLIAADGTGSTIRRALGIQRHGPGVLQHWINVIFDADLPTTLQGREIRSIFATDINGTLVPRGNGRWLMAVQYAPGKGERAEDFTDEHCLKLIRRGAGMPDLEARIVDVRPWAAAAEVADAFSSGRVFLIGDAAHVMPPTGGFGGNTGIHDAHNLAWKLAAVLRNAAGPGLLDTYDVERRPVAEVSMAQSMARLQAWFKDPSKKLPAPEKIIDDDWVIFGYRYFAGALVKPQADESESLFENPHEPSGLPGFRAAHLMLEHRGKRLSTIDLFSDRWVLITGSEGALLAAAGSIALAHSFPLDSYQIGRDGDLQEVESHWHSAYGVGPKGAVLIRPDGFIAWRTNDLQSAPESDLSHAFEYLTYRKSCHILASPDVIGVNGNIHHL